MMSIIIDPKVTIAAVNNRELNRTFALMTVVALNDRLKYRGYLYLNQIYENFGVKWDPKKENTCWTNDQYSTVNAEIKDFMDYGVIVNISIT